MLPAIQLGITRRIVDLIYRLHPSPATQVFWNFAQEPCIGTFVGRGSVGLVVPLLPAVARDEGLAFAAVWLPHADHRHMLEGNEIPAILADEDILGPQLW